jgi:hypothetical protein
MELDKKQTARQWANFGYNGPFFANPDYETGALYFDLIRILELNESVSNQVATGVFSYIPNGRDSWEQFLVRWEMRVVPTLSDWTQRSDIRVLPDASPIVSAYLFESCGCLGDYGLARGSMAHETASEGLSQLYKVLSDLPSKHIIRCAGPDFSRKDCTLPMDETRVQCSILARRESLKIGHNLCGTEYSPIPIDPALLCLWPETRLTANGELHWTWKSTVFSTRSLSFQGPAQYADTTRRIIEARSQIIIREWARLAASLGMRMPQQSTALETRTDSIVSADAVPFTSDMEI